MSTKYQYSDFDIDFGKNEFISDVSMKLERNSIRQSVMNIILTRKGEKPFNRGFGIGLHELLFESTSPSANAKLELDIKHEVHLREPRVSIQSVVVNEEDIDSNTVELIVNYLVLGGSRAEAQPESLRIELQKVR